MKNTGDGPLLVPTWKFWKDATVFLTSGVSESTDPSAVDDRDASPDGTETVAPGESASFKAFFAGAKPLDFLVKDGKKNSEWPAEIREMGNWPDEYADGDTVDVSVVVQDDRGNRTESTTTVTYSGGTYQYDGRYPSGVAAGNVSSQS